MLCNAQRKTLIKWSAGLITSRQVPCERSFVEYSSALPRKQSKRKSSNLECCDEKNVDAVPRHFHTLEDAFCFPVDPSLCQAELELYGQR